MPETNPVADLLFKYLIQSLATEEQQLLNEWLENEENKVFFDKLEDENYILNEFKDYCFFKESEKRINEKSDAMLFAKGA